MYMRARFHEDAHLFELNRDITPWDECVDEMNSYFSLCERVPVPGRTQHFRVLLLMLCMVTWAEPGQAQERGNASLSMQASVQEPPPLCFSEQSLRDHINAQLGYDAFVGDGSETPPLAISVLVSYVEQGALLQATLTTSKPGEAERTRTLSSSQCNDLLDAIVFSLTLVIDPLRATSGEQTSSAEQASRLLHVAASRAAFHTSTVKSSTALHRAIKMARWSARPVMPRLPTGDAKPVGETPASAPPQQDSPSPSNQNTPSSSASSSPDPPRSSPDRPVVAAELDDTTAPSHVREVLLGSSVRHGVLPSADLVIGLGLRQRRGRGAVEVSLLASVPNRYRAIDGSVSLSAHHLDVAGCGVLSSTKGLRPYLLPCARLRTGIFLGRGEGYDVSRDAVRWLLSPGASLHGGVALSQTNLFLQGDLFAGWLATRARYIVQGEEVAKSRPYLLAAGVSIVFRLPER